MVCWNGVKITNKGITGKLRVRFAGKINLLLSFIAQLPAIYRSTDGRKTVFGPRDIAIGIETL